MMSKTNTEENIFVTNWKDTDENETTNKVEISVNNVITIKGCPYNVEQHLGRRLTLKNPKWIENERRGYWNKNTPEFLYFYRTDGDRLIIPRGFINQLLASIEWNKLNYTLHNNTRSLQEVEFEFRAKLYPFQEDAVAAVKKRSFGVLESPTGSGKTVMALYMVAERRQPTLVIVPTKELLYQWRDRAVEFLGLSEDEIGLIGDGKKSLGNRLTIGIINSVYKQANNLRGYIGHMIVDECHRVPSRTFKGAVIAFDCRFILGLSATPYRRDGLTQLLYFFMGDRVHRIDPASLQELNRIMKPKLVVKRTNFNYPYEDDYQKMIKALTQDHDRNLLITKDVLSAAKNNGSMCLVITDRVVHCNALYDLLKAETRVEILTGTTANGERKRIVKDLKDGRVDVLIATSQLIGEGFDLKGLSHIFLATPIKFNGRVKQYTGRILRTAAGKQEAVIHDYLDWPGVLEASYKSRVLAYKELGIEKPQ